jgi:hypothetical protein
MKRQRSSGGELRTSALTLGKSTRILAGLLAPVGTKLEIKGAWVDEGGKERVDPQKLGRASEIHLTGFT